MSEYYLESRLRICHAIQVCYRQLYSTDTGSSVYCSDLFSDALLRFGVSCDLPEEPVQGARRRILAREEERPMDED